MPENNKQVNRRSFLKTATSVLAAPTIITSAALGNAQVPPASERITIGHIGIGGQGSGLLGTFLGIDEAQSIAVSDCFESRRDARATQIDNAYAKKLDQTTYKGCAKYADFQELIAREDIDAIVIATPDHWHVPVALAAVRAGKDVYVEKPLGLSIEQGKTLRAAVNRHGAIFQYGTQQRSQQQFRRACELVRNGRIGKVKEVIAWCAGGARGGSTTPIPVPEGFDYERWLGPAPWSPFTKDRCTSNGSWHVYDNALGFIAGWGAHPLDIAQWGLDMDESGPVSYEGTGAIPTEGLYTAVWQWDITCKYANGIPMRFVSADLVAPLLKPYGTFTDHGTLFVGTDGWVNVDRSRLYTSSEELSRTIIKPEETHLYESICQKRNLVECVKTRRPTINPIESAVRSDTISHLSDIVIRTGRSIKWDPKKEEIIGDPTASRMLSRPMRAPWRL